MNDQPPKPRRRRRHVIKPALQLKVSLVFLGTAAIYVMLQTVLFLWTTTSISSRFPDSSEVVISELVPSLYTNLLITIAVMIPLSVGIGILMTFRVAGPIYRFEMYLKDVARGERPGPCRIREGDEFHELCELINEATAPLRVPPDRPTAGSSETSEPSEATGAERRELATAQAGTPSHGEG